MPKRTRDDRGKESRRTKAPPAQLSAFARRQLLEAKTSTPVSPVPGSSASPTLTPDFSTIRDFTPPVPTSKLKSSKKTKDTTTEISTTRGKPTSSSAPQRSDCNVSTRKKFESALSRQLEDARRRKEAEEPTAVENGRGDAGEDVEDVMSVDGDEEEDGVDPRVLINGRGRANSIATQISSFVPTEINTAVYKPGLSVKYSLKASETLVFQGEYSLRVLSGSIQVYGATLTPSSGTHEVWAPSTHALPVIEALPSKRERKIQEKDGEFDTEIVVSKFNSGIRDIGRLWPMFGGVWAPPNTSNKEDTYHLLTTSTSPPGTLSTPSAWLPLLSDFITPSPQAPVILITGPKSSGKSTLSRTLTNILLNTYPKISYLDLDPGQPEFAPPGMISLSVLSNPIFGPPFTHPAGPVSRESKRHRAHHLGFVSPREDPGGYIQAAGDLFQYYTHLCDSHSDSSLGIPLIRPSPPPSPPQHPSGNASTTISDIHALLPHTTRFHHMPAPAPAAIQAKFSAADLRSLHTMSYFHHSVVRVGGDHEPRISWGFANPLTHVLPWVLSGRKIGAGIHILHLTPPLPPQLFRDAIEGTIVGVILVDNVKNSAEDEGNGDKAGSGLPYPFPGPPPTPETSHCVGLAVIRAIDTTTHEVQLILPQKDSYLSEASSSHEGLALVRGRLEGPVWDFVSEELRVGGRGAEDELPWVTCDGAAGQGGKGVREWRVRRNLMRRGQRAIDDNSPDDESHGHDTHHPNETVGPAANISNERFSRLESDVTSMKISIAVINSQLATLVNDMKEIKANSNRWLFALFGISILKEGRFQQYFRYIQTGPIGLLGIKDNAAGEKAAV
ncbi:hypothetical protein BGX38DRAFT_1277063 [Terfezia claveryi]|nr:hypothetical protein BGX38DRAFT_1277063 [Terfezia claveryi]